MDIQSLNKTLKSTKSAFIILVLLFLLSACSFPPQRTAPLDTQSAPFLPPTIVPTITPTPEPTHPPTGVPQLSCNDNLTYVNDLTIPDGTQVVPQATLDKRWEVDNTGTCNWSEKYTLRLVSGDSLGAPEQQALYPARSGTRATIRLVLSAPEDKGKYHSVWQAYNPDGQPFGDPIYIDIEVIP
jgi:hypothetical protein